MDIAHRADIKRYELYDSESKIETFLMGHRNGKKATFSVKDEFYKDRDLFYNDARMKPVGVGFPVQGCCYNYEMEKNTGNVKYFTSLYFKDGFPSIRRKSKSWCATVSVSISTDSNLPTRRSSRA